MDFKARKESIAGFRQGANGSGKTLGLSASKMSREMAIEDGRSSQRFMTSRIPSCIDGRLMST